jgi:hypothetical protein
MRRDFVGHRSGAAQRKSPAHEALAIIGKLNR